jgi:hypothetical protein
MYNLCNTCERTAAIESVIYPSNTTGVKGCCPPAKSKVKRKLCGCAGAKMEERGGERAKGKGGQGREGGGHTKESINVGYH